MTQRPVLSPIERIGDPAEPFSLLIVDDDEQILLPLEQLLAAEKGYRISTAPDPRKAMALLRARSFDLLIADYRMPEMTGLELIREARRLHPDLVGILITGFAWPDAATEAAEAGAYDLMLKPLNIGEVRVRVRNALERIRLVREVRRYQGEPEQARQEAVRAAQVAESADPSTLQLGSGQAELGTGLLPQIGPFPPVPSAVARGPRGEERVLDQLERLAKLYQTGLLTKEEFALKKAKLFSRI